LMTTRSLNVPILGWFAPSRTVLHFLAWSRRPCQAARAARAAPVPHRASTAVGTTLRGASAGRRGLGPLHNHAILGLPGAGSVLARCIPPIARTVLRTADIFITIRRPPDNRLNPDRP